MKKSLIAALMICLLAQPIAGAFAEDAPPVAVEVTAAPTEEPTAAPTETPTAEPTSEPTAEPTSEPTAEPTEAPTSEPTEEPTDEPTTEPTAEPTEAPIQIVSDKKQIPEKAETWMKVEDGFAYGTIEEMIAYAEEGSEIVLHVQTAMRIKKAPVLKISKLKFSLDADVFAGDVWKIVYLQDDPEKTEEPRELDAETFKDAEEDFVMEMFIRVDSTKLDPVPTEGPVIKLDVQADDYRAGEWSDVLPTFTLSGKPEDDHYSYAAIIYDERIAVLSGDTYSTTAEGVYTLRFAILDAKGDIISASERYTLMLDATQPEVSAMVDESVDYTLHVSASDAMSGVKELSIDGGNTWVPLADGEEWVYTVQAKTTVQPGMLLVRDAAGNTWENAEEYVLDKIPSFPGGGGGGGGGRRQKETGSRRGRQGRSTGLRYC